jgi:hypothetical protein
MQDVSKSITTSRGMGGEVPDIPTKSLKNFLMVLLFPA